HRPLAPQGEGGVRGEVPGAPAAKPPSNLPLIRRRASSVMPQSSRATIHSSPYQGEAGWGYPDRGGRVALQAGVSHGSTRNPLKTLHWSVLPARGAVGDYPSVSLNSMRRLRR